MKCYDVCEKNSKKCKKQECRYWIDLASHSNCTIVASREGSMTLQEIGNIFGITRMRICQIEKKVLEKIRPSLEKII